MPAARRRKRPAAEPADSAATAREEADRGFGGARSGAGMEGGPGGGRAPVPVPRDSLGLGGDRATTPVEAARSPAAGREAEPGEEEAAGSDVDGGRGGVMGGGRRGRRRARPRTRTPMA